MTSSSWMTSWSASSAEGIIEAANLLLNRRDAGEDIYHQTLQDFRERAWASWPRADEILTRELFERCQNAGFESLEEIAVTELDELLDGLQMELDEGEALLQAVQTQLISLASAEREAEEG